MRIQHNIMAMGAYRNYTNNLSAMKKNLEKLSSGYKINRAGDDAAGLAISEKMRAQITGLETAQKNAKDGISLVQTAEGALTEVHDMLNRMVTLATQSANGTYDNETDRFQLQKELDQLKSEIDRIADSSNFNGIKLLDGSLSAGGVKSISSKFDIPETGLILGKDTVLHRDEDENAASTAFGLELHNVEFSGKKDDQFTIEIGGTKLIGTLQKDMAGADALTGKDMVEGLLGKSTDKVTFADEKGIAIDPTRVTIDGKEYNMVEGMTNPSSGEGTGVLFQLNDPETNVNVSMDVKVYAGTDPAAAVSSDITTSTIKGTASTSVVTVSPVGGIDGKGLTNAQVTVDKYTSSGVIDRSKVNFALKDATTDNTTGNVLATFVAGNTPATATIHKAGADYEITFNEAAIRTAVEALGTAPTDTDAFSFDMDASGKFQLKIGTATLGSGVTAAAITAAGYGNAVADGSLFSIKAVDTGNGALNAATDWGTAALTGIADTGLSIATIKGGGAGATSLNKTEITTAALKAGAAVGDIKVSYNASGAKGKQIELKIGNTVIGTANEEDLNNTNGDLNFVSADGVSVKCYNKVVTGVANDV